MFNHVFKQSGSLSCVFFQEKSIGGIFDLLRATSRAIWVKDQLKVINPQFVFYVQTIGHFHVFCEENQYFFFLTNYNKMTNWLDIALNFS